MSNLAFMSLRIRSQSENGAWNTASLGTLNAVSEADSALTSAPGSDASRAPSSNKRTSPMDDCASVAAGGKALADTTAPPGAHGVAPQVPKNPRPLSSSELAAAGTQPAAMEALSSGRHRLNT